MTPLDAILARLDGVRKSGQGYIAKCPAHEDKSPSLSLKEAANGDVVLHCFAGCSHVAVMESIGLKESDLFFEKYEDKKEKDQVYFSKKMLDEIDMQVWFCTHAISDIHKGERLKATDYEKYIACLNNLSRVYSDLKKQNFLSYCEKIDTIKLLGKIDSEYANKNICWKKVIKKLA